MHMMNVIIHFVTKKIKIREAITLQYCAFVFELS